MKKSKIKSIPFLLVFALIFTGCEQEQISVIEEEANLVSNLDRTPAEAVELEIHNEGRGPIVNQYACSELGNYDSVTYVRHTVYLNEFYVPDNVGTSTGTNRYATYMTNLEEWLTYNFNDANPSGNSSSVYFEFLVDGANGSTSLNATNGNRAYNEFVCQLMNELNVSSVGQLDNYEFDLNIIVDYFLCCGSTPKVVVSGTAYN